MWCTRHNAHVSSTYSLVSSIAGVGVATVGASQVQWGWNKGSGLGAIFGGLCMAPLISAGFGAVIFMLIKLVVHMRTNPVPWAIYTSPFFFLIAGTVCALSVVYKGSPKLNLAAKPPWYIATVSVGTGVGLALLAAFFFMPYVYSRVINKDYTLKPWDIFQGPLLFRRAPPPDASRAKVPNYAVIQHGDEEEETPAEQTGELKGPNAMATSKTSSDDEISATTPPADGRRVSLAYAEKGPIGLAPNRSQADYKLLLRQATEKHHAELRQGKGPLGWAMRQVHKHQGGAGSIYELHNLKALALRLPAYPVIALLYGLHYDIHKAQVGVLGTPEGKRMERVYGHAVKYQNEVEYLYSFVQIITACTASFAHGANDVGNAVGVWAAMYAAWSTGNAAKAKEPVPLWQIAVTALTICIGFITYGYNIMKGKSIRICLFGKLTILQSWVTRSPTTHHLEAHLWKWVLPSLSCSSRSSSFQCQLRCALQVPQSGSVFATVATEPSIGSESDSCSSPGL